MNPPRSSPSEHPFVSRPHVTLLALSLPVLLSLVAEPLTGLADTAFISRLGAAPLAALGVGTVLLSGVFWVFNFLGIGAQTQVSRALGAGAQQRAAQMAAMALLLGLGAGILMLAAGLLLATPAVAAMGALPAIRRQATVYLLIRLLGAPAVLVTTSAFGVLRGLQEMHVPAWIAGCTNLANIVLDALLIFGAGPVPALGMAGAALATSVTQVAGAVWAVHAVHARLGWPARLHSRDARALVVAGRDLFLRTGLLTLFLMLTTRVANRTGVEAGAAHQAVRQVWLLTALLLDALAASAQSLVGYFMGAARTGDARRVAGVACFWSFWTGLVLTLTMWWTGGWTARFLVPAAARSFFPGAWLMAALFQPVAALAFATDGIHWGAGDYGYLRNVMLLATGLSALLLVGQVHGSAPEALTRVWMVTGLWTGIRALFGLLRVWPGVGRAPLVAGRPE